MFTKECDLLVVPCDINGNVTYSVMQNLRAKNYPILDRTLGFGSLTFLECPSNAPHKFIAFAAAVQNDDGWTYSQIDIIPQMVKIIESFCLERKLKIINMPLLGTGAGGLDPKSVFTTIKDSVQQKSLVFNVFAFGSDIYIDIINELDSNIKNPRVFISYTGEDEENRNWVEKFAIKLRDNGVDARIDMFDLDYGTDLPQWMTDQLIFADKVILVCDEKYVERANSRKAGVGWETMIIQGDMLSSQNNKKYIAIVRESSVDEGLPIFMKSKYAVIWPKNKPEINDAKFRELLQYLFDCKKAPKIGKVPDFIKDALQ